MAHVKIHQGSRMEDVSVTIDGHDVTKSLLNQDFWVELPKTEVDVARVHMVVAADVLDVDLPAAAITAIRDSEPTLPRRVCDPA